MTQRTRPTLGPLAVLAFGAALTVTGAFPTMAEENRLLPFWGQPFPAGFVRTEPPCTVVRRVPTRRGTRDEILNRCPAVLHAKD